MGEIVIAPEGRDAIDVGGFRDDTGEAFVAICFKRPGMDDVIVTFTPDLFRDFAAHLSNAASAISQGSYWFGD